MQIEEVNGCAEKVTGFHWLCPFQLLFYFSGCDYQQRTLPLISRFAIEYARHAERTRQDLTYSVMFVVQITVYMAPLIT